MPARPMTLQGLEASFEGLLAAPVPGARLPSETGLDEETVAAVEAVWAASPNAPEGVVSAARTEFARMLDGTHKHTAETRKRAIFMAAVEAPTGSQSRPTPPSVSDEEQTAIPSTCPRTRPSTEEESVPEIEGYTDPKHLVTHLTGT
jgi:hypothetical protein